MAPLKGLTGLYGADPQDTQDFMDEGVLESKAFQLDKDHGQYGSQSIGYGGISPSESPFSGMGVYEGGDSEEYGGMVTPRPGEELDSTPVTHAAPYPKGIAQYSHDDPDALARAGTQLRELHGLGFGGSVQLTGNSPAGHEEETHYTTDRYDAPNESYLAKLTEGQLKGSSSSGRGGSAGGNADPDQGYGVLNTLPEFQMGHSIRRVQHDSTVFDYTNTHGEQEVPFPGRHPVYQMPLDGPDSPFYEQGDISGGQIPWEGRIGYPSPYVQPPEPDIVPAERQSDVYAWSGGF